MKFTETRCVIDADPKTIWSILTDTNLLQSSNLGIQKLSGNIALGNKLKLWAEVSPERAFSLKVTEFTPNKSMTWQGGMPFGLFTGTRRFTLNETSRGTEFHMKETFTGALSSMIWKSMPDLNPSFEQFGQGLKALSEKKMQETNG